MLKSTETRWFLSEQSLETIEKWFNNKELFFKDKDLFPRQDYYLNLLHKNLGIKIREPKKDENGALKTQLEIKVLSSDDGAIKFNNGNTAYVNSWKKHSFSLVPDEKETNEIINLFQPEASDTSNWLKVDKDRLLVKFNAESEQLVFSDTMIDEGAGIELTKLKINGNVYYSLGVEAFSVSSKEHENFNSATSYLFNDLKISGLEKEDSLSYPEKLISLSK
jgi:hypothetical protein